MAVRPKYFLKAKLSEDGMSIVPEHAEAVGKVLYNWRGKELQISVERFYKNRSLRQNRYLHGVIVPCIRNHFREVEGVDLNIEEVKSFVYTKILGHRMYSKIILEEEVIVFEGKRFSQMKTVEFNEAVEIVQQYFNNPETNIGLIIPDPVSENNLNDFIWS